MKTKQERDFQRVSNLSCRVYLLSLEMCQAQMRERPPRKGIDANYHGSRSQSERFTCTPSTNFKQGEIKGRKKTRSLRFSCIFVKKARFLVKKGGQG